LVKCASTARSSLFAGLDTLAFAHQASPRIAKIAREFNAWLNNFQRRAESESPTELTRTLLQDIRYDDWLAETSDTPEDAARRQTNVAELVDWIARLEKQGNSRTLSEIVAALTLFDILDRNDDDDTREALALMTLHAAKGLEFPQVFMVGFEENILPHRASIDADTIEEERRLAYVGITRAQTALYLSYARSRRRYGKTEECQPSRFLEELPREDLSLDGSNAVTTDRAAGRATLASLRGLLGSNSPPT
jgi:ATP-dependent DNA helicase Rep